MQNDPLRDADFAELYARYHPRLVRLCRRALHEHEHDAEAVAQEAFVRAWEGSDRYSADRPFWPWVSTIAWHLCIDYLREVARDERIRHRMKHAGSIAPPAPDERLDAIDEAPLVQEALRSLKPRYRRVVRLHHVDGWSYEEVAAFEQVSVESVRGVLKRARALLRASYEHLAEGLVALPGIAWVRRTVDRFLPWVAARVGDVRPPAVAAAAMLLGFALQGVAPDKTQRGGEVSPAAASPVEPLAASGSWTHRSTTIPTRVHEGTTASSAVGHALPESDESNFLDGYRFERVAVAPNDEVYAWAVDMTGSRRPPALVRSADGGMTWERLPADGFVGGARLLFPPAYPADPRIFLSTAVSLSVSPDRGRTFLPLSATVGYAAMAPDFSTGREIFLFGNAPGWFFDVSRKTTMPTGLPVPPSLSWANFAFGPRHAEDGTVYMAAHTFVDPLRTATTRPVVWVCRSSGCVEAKRGDPHEAPPELVVSPVDGSVWAFTTRLLWRSRDGETFEALRLPARVSPESMVFAGGAIYLAAMRGHDQGGVFRSLDGGDTWEEPAPGRFRVGPTALAALSDGTLFAAMTPGDGGGLLRSTDGGTTWQQVL